jgi:hypothetical protein
MSAQKRETAKNYIGLLSEETEEPRAADAPSVTERRIKAYVLWLRCFIAAAKRGRHARPVTALNMGDLE